MFAAWPEPQRAMAAAANSEKGPSPAATAEPMRRLMLPNHYGRTVEVDLCSHCHLVWFDLTETARLSGPRCST